MPKTIASKPVVRKPAAPPALAKPAKPGAPAAKPAAHTVVVPPPRPSAPGAPNTKPATAAPSKPELVLSKPSARENELASEIAALKGQMAELLKAATKAKGPRTRTVDDIIGGVFDEEGNPLLPGVKKDDWRRDYQGLRINVKGHQRAESGKGKIGKLVTNDDPTFPVLLAIPRDEDGTYATTARNRGEIAIHTAQREDGTFSEEPDYLTAEELTLIWDSHVEE